MAKAFSAVASSMRPGGAAREAEAQEAQHEAEAPGGEVARGLVRDRHAVAELGERDEVGAAGEGLVGVGEVGGRLSLAFGGGRGDLVVQRLERDEAGAEAPAGARAEPAQAGRGGDDGVGRVLGAVHRGVDVEAVVLQRVSGGDRAQVGQRRGQGHAGRLQRRRGRRAVHEDGVGQPTLPSLVRVVQGGASRQVVADRAEYARIEAFGGARCARIRPGASPVGAEAVRP